ncbi:UDP-N-acetylmuramoyl-L-alanyl-D-glutamate--2,6-diaminopimelate ligase [Candidatus Peregrinibacteria bacterium]|nr:UDP-N-acetylmuramoyl-L-alanyl-D-glutamate--2,6-diaminopimelate ligase [Candidatus Peregrinibacteria bacterium]
MLNFLRRFIPDTHPIRLLYHRIMAVSAAFFYLFPAEKLHVIAVTGTNGKTTTVNLLAHILEKSGAKVGISSSIFFQIGQSKWHNVTKQTTLGPFFLQRLLSNMVRAKCRYAILEATSHSMTQSRLWGINVDMAVLTNITSDHIEYHGSYRRYVEAKGQLFSNLQSARRKNDIPKISILNRDSKEFEYFDRFLADRKLTYGLSKRANYTAKDLELRADGSTFTLKIPNETAKVHLKLPGKFNVDNALAAASAALGCGVPLATIVQALDTARGFPGRYESIDEGQDFSVIVDYAHTPDALEEACRMFKELTARRLIVVFGATGGGRDKSKRSKMGKIVSSYADLMIVTNDDPYEEDELEIIEQICHGVDRREGHGLWKIVDRAAAIRCALRLARKDDTVLITGKGCESVILLKQGRVPHDDREVVRRELRGIV